MGVDELELLVLRHAQRDHGRFLEERVPGAERPSLRQPPDEAWSGLEQGRHPLPEGGHIEPVERLDVHPQLPR